MASSTYKIAVRTVHPPGDLLHIELGREALVADLHEALRLLHPLQPEKERQRLLFAGRLLRDPREPLASVFQAFPNIPVYTVHLMLAPPSTTSPPPHPPAQEIPRAAEGVAPGDRHGDGRPPGVHVHVHINLSLLLKLALLILVLSQGGGTNRLLFLCLASAFFYMYTARSFFPFFFFPFPLSCCFLSFGIHLIVLISVLGIKWDGFPGFVVL
jgi:hypothetical protein